MAYDSETRQDTRFMRIGIFGGTFDPVHYGHLLMAELAREQAGLDQVWFMPSFQPPHKHGQTITPFERRVDMLRLALAGQEDRFSVNLIEQERSGPSYTVDTLNALTVQHPAHEWFLILGADCLPDLPKWHEPQQLVRQTTLVSVGRPGHVLLSAAEIAASLNLPTAAVTLVTVRVPLIELSSREIRQRVHDGQSILFQLPRAVEVYIRERKLYR